MIEEAKDIVLALKCCPDPHFRCEQCPVYDPEVPCQNELKAAKLIEFLLAELEKEQDKRQHADEHATLCREEWRKIKRERDMMYDILSNERNCCDCIHLYVSHRTEPCRTCLENTNTKANWKWRGMNMKGSQYEQAICAGLRKGFGRIEQALTVASYKRNLLTFEEAVEDDYYLERKDDQYVDIALNIYAAYHDDPHPGDVMHVKTHYEDNVSLLRVEYGKTWRCWRFRPTQEERNSIPWEE